MSLSIIYVVRNNTIKQYTIASTAKDRKGIIPLRQLYFDVTVKCCYLTNLRMFLK